MSRAAKTAATASYELVTIRFSHYNERARWALDHYEVAYKEVPYMPTFHFVGSYLARLGATQHNARPDAISTPYSTPILVVKDGNQKRCICDSFDIMKYATDHFATPETTLFPTTDVNSNQPSIEELCERFHSNLGPHSRRTAYHYCLAESTLARALAGHNVSSFQALQWQLLFPVAKSLLIRGLGISEKRALRSMKKVEEEFEYVAELLHGKRYLLGDRFTAADLTFACMAAPALRAA